MDKYQFKIENTIVTNPEGWKDFEIRLKRDDEIAGLLVTSTNKFTFRGNGFTDLHERFLANYNDKVDVTIDFLQSNNTYLLKYKGVVKLTNITFNLEKKTAETIIIDANFQGAINANKKIKTFISSAMSKNGEILTAPTIYNLDYFIVNGTYQSLANRRAYLLKDALDFLVRFMTDNEVKGVQSAYLDDVTNFEGASLPYITTGFSIRLANQVAPNVSFSECITFLQKTHDLTFDFVTDTNGDPVMRIEDRAFFFGSSSSETIRDIVDLKVKVDTNKIASHIEVGNNTTHTTGNCSITTRWFSFQKEDYGLRGKGNIDKLIDLTTDFITDSNIIQVIVVSALRTWDEDVIIVLGNAAGTQATKFASATYCSGTNIYNQGFTNDKIIGRMIESVPNSVAKYLTAATTPSRARIALPVLMDSFTFTNPLVGDPNAAKEGQVNFPNEEYDLGSNYNTSNLLDTFYDVPFAGNFSFEAIVNTGFQVALSSPGIGYEIDVHSQIAIQRFSSSNILQEQTLSPLIKFRFETGNQSPIFVPAFRRSPVSASFTCSSGDRIKISLIVRAPSSRQVVTLSWEVSVANSLFTCLGSELDAGVFKIFDPNSFKARNYTFEKNVSLTRTDNIRANPTDSIVINESSDQTLDKTTWIEEMVTNQETGATSFTTIN